jgi:hypothetical protein
MTNGMRLMCAWYTVLGPFYQRQAECGYRGGAGDRGRRAVITEAGRAPGLGCAWLGG